MFAANSAKSPQVFSGARSQVWSVCVSATLQNCPGFIEMHIFFMLFSEREEKMKGRRVLVSLLTV